MPYTEHILIAGDRNRACEDMIIAEQVGAEGLFAVLDGASELNGVNLGLNDSFGRPMTGGEWIVRNVASSAARRMRNPISHQPLMELVKALETEAMYDVVRRTDVEPWQRPACIGVFVRVTRDRMDWLQFGDCMGAAELQNDELVMLGNNRDAWFKNIILTLMAQSAAGMDDEMVQAALQAERMTRNFMAHRKKIRYRNHAALDGNLNPKLCVSGSFPRANVKRFVLFSNGMFHEPNYGAKWFAQKSLQHGLLETCNDVQQYEHTDNDRKLFPRFKQHDDKAALLVTF